MKAQALKLQIVEVALEVQEPLVTHDVLEPLAHLLYLCRIAIEDVGEVLVEAVRQHVLDARRINAVWVSPTLAELACLCTVGTKRAAFKMLS